MIRKEKLFFSVAVLRKMKILSIEHLSDSFCGTVAPSAVFYVKIPFSSNIKINISLLSNSIKKVILFPRIIQHATTLKAEFIIFLQQYIKKSQNFEVEFSSKGKKWDIFEFLN